MTAAAATPRPPAGLAAPADARRLFAWRRHDGHSARAFTGYQSRIGPEATPVLIEVLGLQFDDGATARTIGVDGMPEEMTPALARAVAAALIEAAERIEAAAESDGRRSSP